MNTTEAQRTAEDIRRFVIFLVGLYGSIDFSASADWYIKHTLTKHLESMYPGRGTELAELQNIAVDRVLVALGHNPNDAA